MERQIVKAIKLRIQLDLDYLISKFTKVHYDRIDIMDQWNRIECLEIFNRFALIRSVGLWHRCQSNSKEEVTVFLVNVLE